MRVAGQTFETAAFGDQAEDAKLQRETGLDPGRAGRCAGLVIDYGKAAVREPVEPVRAAVDMDAVEGHRAVLLDRQHAAVVIGTDLLFDPAQRGFEPWLPQPPHQRIGVLFVEHGLHDRGEAGGRIPLARFVPALQDGVRHRPLPLRRRFGVQRVEILQPHDPVSIELVGIAKQAIERGRGNVDLALFGLRLRCRTRIGRRARRAGHRPRQRDRLAVLVAIEQLAQQRLHAQQETRGNGRAGLVPFGTRQDHLGRAERPGEVMRRKSDTEIGAGHAQRAEHRRGKQRVDPPADRPDAFIQSGADYQFGAVHPAFEQPEHLHPRMPPIGRPDRHLFHGIAQRNCGLARRQGEPRLARMTAQFLHEASQRTAVLACPELFAAQRFAAFDQRIEQGVHRDGILPVQRHQRRKRLIDRGVPIGHAAMPLGQPRRDSRDGGQAARLARPAQRAFDPAQLP